MSNLPPNIPLNTLGLTPLHLACSVGNQQVLQTIMHFSPNINQLDGMGRTPLHFAAAKGNIHALEILLNSPDIMIDPQSLGGETPLMRAISFGQVEAV
mmetsp:Transcript_33672/g.24701  ORF Transcript_33672/g.24701 Transcript_33672/m.24701 type:complete len:98 (-) Transcript_33672:257-550(-)